MIAYAAWLPISEPDPDEQIIGWRAIALGSRHSSSRR